MSTWVDSAIILGFSGYCYLFGYDALWIAIPTSIGIYSFSILFVKKINKMKEAFTVSSILEKAYGKDISVISSFFVLLYSITLISTNIMAAGHIMHVIMGVPYIFGASFVLFVAVFYTILGGFRKVVETDIIQFFFVIFGLLFVSVFSLRAVGGWSIIKEEALLHSGAFSVSDIISFFIIFTFSFWANPSFYQRCSAAKSPKVASIGVATVGLIDFVMTICALVVGLSGTVILGNNMLPDTVFLQVIKSVLPRGIRELAGLAVLSAVISTEDSYLLISGGIIAHDILRPLSSSVSFDEVKITKIGIIFCALLSLLGTLWFDNIIEMAAFAFSLFISSNLIPLVFAFYSHKAHSYKWPALGSMVGGGTSVILWKVANWGDVYTSVIFGLLVSVVSWIFICKFQN